MHFKPFEAILDHVFLSLRGGGLFFLFIFHTLGGGVSESMEISILFFFLNPSLNRFLNVKAFNQEKALLGAFFAITNLRVYPRLKL